MDNFKILFGILAKVSYIIGIYIKYQNDLERKVQVGRYTGHHGRNCSWLLMTASGIKGIDICREMDPKGLVASGGLK